MGLIQYEKKRQEVLRLIERGEVLRLIERGRESRGAESDWEREREEGCWDWLREGKIVEITLYNPFVISTGAEIKFSLEFVSYLG